MAGTDHPQPGESSAEPVLGSFEQLPETTESLLRIYGDQATHYLKEFRSLPPEQFALIKAGGEIMQDPEQLAAFSWGIKVLYDSGLYPVIVHGAGPQIKAAVGAAGLPPSRWVDDLRYNDEPTRRLSIGAFYEASDQLVAALSRRGVSTRPLHRGVFFGEPLDQEKHGYVGGIEYVDLAGIKWAIQDGRVPIVSPVGQAGNKLELSINADPAAAELVKAIEPHRYIALTASGGVLDDNGDIISTIDTTGGELEELLAHTISGGMALKAREAAALLQELPETSGVSFTSAAHLIAELFTHEGSGTLLHRGEPIGVYHSLQAVDRGLLQYAIEASFGRRLSRDYWQLISQQRHTIYVPNRSYAGAAVMTGPEAKTGVRYLDKFAVSPQAQGLGIANQLWRSIVKDNPGGFYWRSRPHNPNNAFYEDGRFSGEEVHGDWKIYWYGFEDSDQINACIKDALERPPTLG